MHDIRHIATSESGSVFLTAEFECKVYAWDLNGFKAISEFELMKNLDGHSLDITNDGKTCLIAAYNRKGTCLYDVATCELIWQRKDLTHVYNVNFSLDETIIYVGMLDRSMKVVNSATGNDIKKFNQMTNIYINPYGENDYFLKKNPITKKENIVKFGTIEIQSPTFTYLDVAPTDMGVAVSAVGNSLMLYNFEGEKVWEIVPKKGEHFKKLSYAKKLEIVHGVMYKYDDPREQPFFVLYAINAANGEMVYKFDLPEESFAFGFAEQGEKLICSSGEVYQLSHDMPVLIHKFDWE